MTRRKLRMLAAAMAVVFPMAALPLLALAQAAAPAPATPPGAAQAGQGAGLGRWARMAPERKQKRMRLARTLGLAEALDLEPAQALKLGDTLAKFDERRVVIHKQLRDARDVLQRAAQGEKVTAAEVDGAIQKGLDARAHLHAIDRETLNAVTQGLSPEKKARAVLFLASFHRHFRGPQGPGMGPGPGGAGMGPGPGGPGRAGMGPARGMGPGGRGRGPGGGWGMAPAGDEPAEMLGMGPPPMLLDDEDGE